MSARLNCSDVGITIKQKLQGSWVDVPQWMLDTCTLQQFLDEFGGGDTIAKMETRTGPVYFVGTDELKKSYLKRGDMAMTFSEAIDRATGFPGLKTAQNTN